MRGSPSPRKVLAIIEMDARDTEIRLRVSEEERAEGVLLVVVVVWTTILVGQRLGERAKQLGYVKYCCTLRCGDREGEMTRLRARLKKNTISKQK